MNNWADRLISEYTRGREALQVKRDNLSDSFEDDLDRKTINSMINDMSEIIKWLKFGKDPSDFRSNEKRSAYQRRLILDMDMFPTLDIMPESLKETSPRELSEKEKESITKVLIELSWRERQCYLLHYANRRTFQEISDELGVTKSAVQKYIERARAKIDDFLSCHTGVI